MWTDAASFWKRMSLGQLDAFVLNLGHAGEECPAQDYVRRMTIVHEHGIIEMKVRFCNCVAKGDKFRMPEPMQLLRFGLFPGTWKEPHTAFTINGLRDYHLLSVQCQITGIDFATYLQRSTDNVLSKDVTVSALKLVDMLCTYVLIRNGTGSLTTQCASSCFCAPQDARASYQKLAWTRAALLFFVLPVRSTIRTWTPSGIAKMKTRMSQTRPRVFLH